MKRSAVFVLALLAVSSTASANVEVGGVAGLHIFSSKSNLGYISTSPQATTQKNSALFGMRLGVYVSNALGLELEGGLIPSESRTLVFDVFNIAARAQVVYQFRTSVPEHNLIPFVLAGAGMLDLVKTNNSDVLKKDLEVMGHIGAGVKYRTAAGWGVRFDARALLGKSNASGVAVDFELLASLYREWGRPTTEIAKTEDTTKPAAEGADADNDGILDALDKCPKEAEDKDGFQDEDGCPDPDNDGDGIADANDKCPTEAEDKDDFQDDDGCPDPDNDQDGIPDAADKCGDQPETHNGFQDDDGCPDELPEQVKSFTGAIQGISFRTGSDKLLPSSNKVLDKAVAVLKEYEAVKLEIQGHTDDVALKNNKQFSDNMVLSQARADAVKAYFVSKGIDEGRLTAKGYGDTQPAVDPSGLKGRALNAARAKNRRVEFKLIVSEGAAATPATPSGDGAGDASGSKPDDATPTP